MKFNCGNCGEVEYVIIDGYGYGDRLLEGVTFEVRRDDDGKFHAQVEEFSRDYFAQFNQAMYLEKIEQGMETEEFAICPQCGEEVTINKLAPHPVREVQMHSIGEILGGFGGMVGTAVPVEDVGDRTEDTPAEEEETSSTEGGDSGGGGASGDLDDKDGFERDEETDGNCEECGYADCNECGGRNDPDASDDDDSSDDSSDSDES